MNYGWQNEAGMMGTTAEIVAVLTTAMATKPVVLDGLGVKVGCRGEVLDAHYAAMQAELEGAYSEKRDAIRSRYQLSGPGRGEAPYSLGSNMYGWATGSHFLSNIRGGRFADTARGANLTEALAYGCSRANSTGGTFTFSLTSFPEDTARAVLALLGGDPDDATRYHAAKAGAKLGQAFRSAELQAEKADAIEARAPFVQAMTRRVEAQGFTVAKSSVATAYTFAGELYCRIRLVVNVAKRSTVFVIVTPEGVEMETSKAVVVNGRTRPAPRNKTATRLDRMTVGTVAAAVAPYLAEAA